MKSPIGFSRVKFNNPFRLKGVDGEQISGTYGVEVRDDRMGWLWFLKKPLQSTWITIRHFHGLKGKLEDYPILPGDLIKALDKDKGTHAPHSNKNGFIHAPGRDTPSPPQTKSDEHPK